MTLPAAGDGPQIVQKDRVFPQLPVPYEHVVPLSLLDATTAKFGLTSAVWLFETPNVSTDFANHLRQSLGTALNAYPQWCGHLRAVLSPEGDDLPPETAAFPLHARRYGRVYVQYGTPTDPGIEFVEATSTATVDGLYDSRSASRRPIWNRKADKDTLIQYAPPTTIVHALESNEKDIHDRCKPILAVQLTTLACGGLILAAKIAHPLADISALTRFVRDWASISRAMLIEAPLPILSPVFDPSQLDACAVGNINADEPNPDVMRDALGLPLHRYDWWAKPGKPPFAFPSDLPPAGKPLPWDEWDAKGLVDQHTVHFSRDQIDHLWNSAMQRSKVKVSKHDALLAHIWSCVVRARGLQEDQGPVHCDLVLGTRPAFQLGDSFIGSPTMMLNIEMTASDVSSGGTLGAIASRIRETVLTVNDHQRLAAHLHSVAHEKSPQRIWQGFLGQRHIMVTTWARAGIYDVDFGLGSRIRYADGMVPCLDGCILIVDGPPKASDDLSSGMVSGWTDHGVEVTLPLRCEDMERLLQDPLLLPGV